MTIKPGSVRSALQNNLVAAGPLHEHPAGAGVMSLEGDLSLGAVESGLGDLDESFLQRLAGRRAGLLQSAGNPPQRIITFRGIGQRVSPPYLA